jgi:flagellin
MQVINTNISSLNAQRNLDNSQMSLSTSLQRLSSGLRINSAKDDAAGLAISQRMTAQINGSDQARRNANDGVSMAQTGEGAMQQMSDILQRIRQLAVQSANATNSASDRQALNAEVTQLTSELDRFAQSTEFNGLKLFDGSISTSIFQVGANANQTITATTSNFRTSQYGTFQTGNSNHTSAVALSNGFNISAVGQSGNTVVKTSGVMTIRGFAGTATISGVTGDTAKTLAERINAQSAKTGVTAAALTNAAFYFGSGGTQPGSGTYTLDVLGNQDKANYSTISFSITKNSNGSLNLSQVVSAFNDKASQTGITAKLSDDGKDLILTNSDGGNILVKSTTLPAGAAVSAGYMASGNNGGFVSNHVALVANNDALSIGGQLTINSNASFAITTDATLSLREGAIDSNPGGDAINTTVASNLQSVLTLDVSSVESATQALRTVDGALAAVNDQRAKFGALQSRFQATISNLQITSENLSASRSRIQDTDFAQETSNLTRSQILQQAGTAMLAQANALPQQVLSLLKG